MISISDSAWEVLVVIHGGATFFLAGLIWTIQLVHYPSFSSIDPDRYEEFQRRHMSRMGVLVGPPWLVEGIAVILLFVAAPTAQTRALAAVGGVLELIVIGVTVLVSIPAHDQLTRGFDEPSHRRLVGTNWYRTLAWTGRAVVAVLLLLAI